MLNKVCIFIINKISATGVLEALKDIQAIFWVILDFRMNVCSNNSTSIK